MVPLLIIVMVHQPCEKQVQHVVEHSLTSHVPDREADDGRRVALLL